MDRNDKTAAIAELITEHNIQVVKLHRTRSCGGKWASNWPTPARLWRR
jgi:hypothetical protein